MENNKNIIGQNLKTVRKQSGFKNQTIFANELGTSQTAYSKYETGDVVPADSFIKLVCERFSINETWLRTGEGEMKKAEENPILTELRKSFQLDKQDEVIITSFLELNPDNRAAVKRFILSLAEELKALQPADHTALPTPQDRAVLHQQLEDELNAHDGKKSSPSAGTATAAK